MKSMWNENSTADKVMLIIRIIASVAVLICASLQLFGVWDKALNIATPLLSIVILIQSIQERKEHKGAAVLGFCCAAFIFICTIVVWFMK